MNLLSLRTLTLRQKRLLAASLVALTVGVACGDDNAAPPTPVIVSLTFASLDGSENTDEPVPLRCDGTLAVDLALSTTPDNIAFLLRPAHACASSPHCGYLHIEALDADGAVVASVDSATTGGLLKIPRDDRDRVVELQAHLLRGIDDEPVLNPDKTEVVASIAPAFTPTEPCPEIDETAGGAGGASGASGASGTPVLGGTGGAADVAAGGRGEAIGGAGGGGV